MIANWKLDLYQEKSLYQVYRASRKHRKSRFNRAVYITVFVFVTIVSVLWVRAEDVQSSAKAASEVAEIAFDLTVQILGFLIGGFAIFATVTDDRLMIRLAQAPMSDGASVFKHVFYSFLSVFFIYVVTLSCAIAVKVLDNLNAVNPSDIFGVDRAPVVISIFNSFIFAALTLLVSLSVVRLKSFIWNIYQGFITFLSVSELMQQENAESGR